MSSAASDSQVQASLALLSQTCSLSIAAINTKSDAQAPPLSTLHADAISLLSVIYSNTTKLSIALNPSNPAYSAALTVLKDLTTYSSTLASNASLFFPNVHGRALTAEVQYTARSVLSALQELAHAHIALLAKPEPKHATRADAHIPNHLETETTPISPRRASSTTSSHKPRPSNPGPLQNQSDRRPQTLARALGYRRRRGGDPRIRGLSFRRRRR
jgi:hypothetical protein